MPMLFIFGNDPSQPDKCRCIRCNDILPDVHGVEHLCLNCLIEEWVSLMEDLEVHLKEVLNADKE